MEEKVFCEKCGSEMTPYKKGHTSGMICEKCGFGWVTTCNEEIEVDETIYEISLLKDTNVSTEKIKVVSNEFAVNFLTARKMLTDGQNIVFKGKAIKVKEKKEELDKNNIRYSIIPEFSY